MHAAQFCDMHNSQELGENTLLATSSLGTKSEEFPFQEHRKEIDKAMLTEKHRGVLDFRMEQSLWHEVK